MSFIDKHYKKFIVFFVFCIALEFGIGAIRFPREMRYRVYPKLHRVINNQQMVVDRCNETIDEFIRRDSWYKGKIELLYELLGLSVGDKSEHPYGPVHYLPPPPRDTEDSHAF